MQESVQPEATSTGMPQSTPPASQDAEQTTTQDVPQKNGAESQDSQLPEMRVSDEEVDRQVAACWKNYRTSKHELGRWLREKKRRLVGRGRNGEWEPWVTAPERDIPLSTANDLIRRFEEREGLRPVVVKVPDSGTFPSAEDAPAGNPKPAVTVTATGDTAATVIPNGGLLSRLFSNGGYLRRLLFNGGQHNASSPTTDSEPPSDIFIPAGQITDVGIKKLEKEQEEATDFPKARTRVQLPECTKEDRKRFENSLAELGDDYRDNKDSFQLALSAIDFQSRLIQGGLLNSLNNLRKLAPRYHQLDDCQLVLECVRRIEAQIGACNEPQDYSSAA